MFSFWLNKSRIIRTGDSVFNHINSFFLGNINSTNYHIDRGHPVENVSISSHREWNLNQGYSDIFIRDIRLIFSYLMPVSLIHALSKVRRNILIYFYIDDLEEEVGGSREQIPPESFFSLKIAPKVAIISGQVQKRLAKGVISFLECWNNIVRKLELLLGLKNDDKIYYLIGNFSCQRYNNESSDQPSKIRGPDQFNIKSSVFFHKRN